MIQGIGKGGTAAAAAAQPMEVVNTPINTGGASGPGGYVSQEVDAKESAAAPKFGDVYKQIQAKYGAKADKPREIKKTLGKDDFLRIMITQMKNQDPTNPFKAEQMATEIAQFTSVEQLQNVNQNLNKMATQNKPIEQMAMTNMIGKVVTVDRERFPHQEGQAETLSFALPRNAASLNVAVISEAGEEVFNKDLGEQKAGEVNFNWDGLKGNTLAAKSGTYIFRVEAKDQKGQAIETNPQTQGRVIGISFEGSEPVFLVGDAQRQDKITMRNIIKIDVDNGQALGTKMMADPTRSGPHIPNLISFQKGVGSSNGDVEMLKSVNPDAAKALEKPLVPPTVSEEKGFPNGLKDPDPVQMQSQPQKGGEIK